MQTRHSVDREGLMSEFRLMGVAKMTTPYQILKNSNLVTERVNTIAALLYRAA